jgi:hypothetical protein
MSILACAVYYHAAANVAAFDMRHLHVSPVHHATRIFTAATHVTVPRVLHRRGHASMALHIGKWMA